jgi:hypothetical protein
MVQVDPSSFASCGSAVAAGAGVTAVSGCFISGAAAGAGLSEEAGAAGAAGAETGVVGAINGFDGASGACGAGADPPHAVSIRPNITTVNVFFMAHVLNRGLRATSARLIGLRIITTQSYSCNQ